MGNTIIKLDDIAKSFGNVRVIEHISFSIEEGKVYALAGENGAGKSTLCNIISGSLMKDLSIITESAMTILRYNRQKKLVLKWFIKNCRFCL